MTPTLPTLQKVILKGGPRHKNDVATDIKHYWDFATGIIKREKILIPEDMIPTVLDVMHQNQLMSLPLPLGLRDQGTCCNMFYLNLTTTPREP